MESSINLILSLLSSGLISVLIIYHTYRLYTSHGSSNGSVNIFSANTVTSIDPVEIENLIDQRSTARQNRDFALSDSIRDSLLEKGIILEDKETGTVWKKN